ncbi:hypothetical protein E2C01_065144 [Portunus trituberculatus]|uniref:Uncharacterized protein n=1 Tax=Portunus trituberculatus TaxID=210409 RepID=A0A5B7HI30_PORTR|nr:hypothetical protein [Portunus trituberculatus]
MGLGTQENEAGEQVSFFRGPLGALNPHQPPQVAHRPSLPRPSSLGGGTVEGRKQCIGGRLRREKKEKETRTRKEGREE